MVEMEEIKYSRELLREVIEKCEDPVHYISHHAVIRLEKKAHQSELSLIRQQRIKGAD